MSQETPTPFSSILTPYNYPLTPYQHTIFTYQPQLLHSPPHLHPIKFFDFLINTSSNILSNTMTHENKTYNLTECFYYEGITRQYTLREKKELSIYELITFGVEDNFNYTDFLIFKRLHMLKELITQNTGPSFDINNAPDLEDCEDYYEEWLSFYTHDFNRGLCSIIRIENLIEHIVKNKHWDVLHCIYSKEKRELNCFVADKEEEINEHKQKEKMRTHFIII